MSKTLTIEIRPFRDMADDFRAGFEAAQHGHRFKQREGVYFTSLEAARNFLTKERLALVRAIREHRPRSIYALAKIVDRDLKNVQHDVALLERHGLIQLTEQRRGERGKIRVPEAPFDEISLRIAV